jgi:hypothetical protein
MAKGTYRDMVGKERESVKEVGSNPVRPTDTHLKNVGLTKGETAKTESPAYKEGVETGRGKTVTGRKGKSGK